MNMQRLLRHLLMTPWRLRRAFPLSTLDAIEHAIRSSEPKHAGQIRFAVEGALHSKRLIQGQSPRERALEVFSQLRMWDTEHRNGVLIYVLLADRAVEVIADRGAHGKIGAHEWEGVCRMIQAEFGRGRYEAGAISGIEAVARHLAKHFVASATEARELPERPAVL